MSIGVGHPDAHINQVQVGDREITFLVQPSVESAITSVDHLFAHGVVHITQTTFDAMGRTTRVIQDYVDGVVAETELDTDKTVDTVYDSVGRMSQQIAYNPKGTGLGVESQITQYIYATIANQASPAIFRNDVLAAIIYPDSDDTYNPAGGAGAQLANGTDGVYDRVEYTYDYAGRKSTIKDQRGVVHTMNYDAQGRLLSDAATTVPSGVDASVLRIEYGFDDLSRTTTVTSFNAVSAGTVVNQTKNTFDGWGNVIKNEQAHVGSVVVGTPSYQATFADGASGGQAKYVRPSSFTYPNGRVVNVGYPGAIDDKLSRAAQLSDSTGSPIYAQYTYWGAGSVMQVTHPEVSTGLILTYVDIAGVASGLDRFGRVITHPWGSSTDSIAFESLQYAYDNMGRRLSSVRLYTGGPSNRSELYSYDNLHRLKNMKRGQYLDGTITDAMSTLQIDWPELDTLGNWRTWRWDLNGGVPAWSTQARKHNKANEIDVDNNDANAAGASITQVGGSGMNWVDPTYDKAGNMKITPKPGAETTAASKLTLTFDAWNRLVITKTGSSGATELAEYQYDGNHQRIVKLKPNGSNWDRTDYYYNGSGQVLEERTVTAVVGKTTVATVPKYQWVWDLRYQDAPILRDQNKDGDGSCTGAADERLYYMNDVNWNTTALITKAGVVVERYAYNPYGAVFVFTGAWATQASTVYNNEILFSGYRQDPESGLYHVRRRASHPTLGRFIQRDPVGYHDGMDLYEYVGSTPTMATDPSGLLRIVTNQYGTDPRVLWDNGSFTWNGTPGGASTYVPMKISMSSVFAIAGLGGFCPTCNARPGGGVEVGSAADKLDQAIAAAKTMLEDAAKATNQLAFGDSQDLLLIDRFAMWFGEPSEKPRAQLVASRYYAAMEEIYNPNYKSHLVVRSAPDNNFPTAYANTVGTSPNYTTELFPRAMAQSPSTPPSSIAGILIHELIHALPGDLGIAWDPAEIGLAKMGTPKTRTEPNDLNLWKNWVRTWGPPNGPGGDGWPYTYKFGKVNDPNVYKYFAEGE